MFSYLADYPALSASLGLLSALSFHAALTNPTRRIHMIRRPFTTEFRDGRLLLHRRASLRARQDPLSQGLAYYKCAAHILANRYAGGRKTRRGSISEVVRHIHKTRFDPRDAYLISGDHFNVLYPRNMGVFYHSLLDSRTVHDEKDWERRQRIYLQTVAFALESFRSAGDCSTTIVPLGMGAVSCIDIYRYPSDALYGILFALSSLLDASHMAQRYPFAGKYRPLRTTAAARELLAEHADALENLLQRYRVTLYDEQRGLVRTDRSFSGAKDASLRESAFYDNVIFWSVCGMAGELGLTSMADIDTLALKERVIRHFWIATDGYFAEDLSGARRYSADWLAAIFTGFLDSSDTRDLDLLRRATDYAEQAGITDPLPIRYQVTSGGKKPWLIRLAASEYGGATIWSFWGAEHIKALLIVYQRTGIAPYLERAQQHIAAYEAVMVETRGYPEVYDASGKPLRNLFYKSVRQTGWVVGFEQAQHMAKASAATR